MKKYFIFSSCALLIIATLGCTKALKNVEDYAPEVSMVSAEIQEDGTVLLKGTLVSPGKQKGDAVEYAGFCFNTDNTKTPALGDNQIIGQLSGNSIEFTCPSGYLSEDSTYSISVWAANGSTYTVSAPIVVSKLKNVVNVPCTFDVNRYKINSQTDGYSNVTFTQGTDGYTLRCDGYAIANYIEFHFSGKPYTRQYKTAEYGSNQEGKVEVVFVRNGWGTDAYRLKSNQSVYVVKKGDKFEVSLCGATFTSNLGTETFTTHIEASY